MSGMPLEEHTVDDALPRRCEQCGAELTELEIYAASETDGPFVCTTHATEELPVPDDAAVEGSTTNDPPPPAGV